MMRQVKNAVCLLSLLALNACGHGVADRVQPGITPASEIQKTLGSPSRIVKPSSVPQAEVLVFKSDPDCTYQREGEVIVQVACDPKPHETELQYWLHRWAGQRLERTAGAQGPHGTSEQLLHNPKARQIVFYDSAGAVKKVVRYGRP